MVLTQKDKEALAHALRGLESGVRLVVFTHHGVSRDCCPLCAESVALTEDLASASDKVEVEFHDLVAEPNLAAAYGVDLAPAIVMLGPDGQDPGIRFFGIPDGFELATLIQAMVLLSSGDPALQRSTKDALAELREDVTIKVFVTPTCPYCPRAALTAMQFAMASEQAMASERVWAEIVEASEFPELAARYRVMAVPKIVINDRVEVEGAVPEARFLQAVLDAAHSPTPVAVAS